MPRFARVPPIALRIMLALALAFGLPSSLPARGAVPASRPLVQAPECARRPAAGPALERLRAALAHGRFVAYQPTALQVHDGRATRASADSIRADLLVLRPRFDSLVTYGALHGAEQVPAIAAALGYRAVVIGVWDPFDAREVAAAVAAALEHPQLVVGLSLGNELVFAKRRRLDELPAMIAGVRARAPGLALSTTEPFHVFYDAAARPLLRELDFLLANVHPVFQPWWREAPDANGAQFVVGAVQQLRARYCGPVLVKETGVPTAPASAGYTPQRQAAFYRELRQQFPPSRASAFAYFSAFDAPWRVADEQAVPGHHPEEAHWGLFEEDRRPKAAAQDVPVLARPPR